MSNEEPPKMNRSPIVDDDNCSEKDVPDDDDGIEDFLTDAIGLDGDVFKEIGDSDTLAELLEVVTASFTPTSGTSTSRRNSLQESSENSSQPQSSNTEASSSTRKKVSPSKSQRIVYEKQAKKKKDSAGLETSTSEKIKNRLKIRPKCTPQQQRCDNSTKPPPKQKASIQKSSTTKIIPKMKDLEDQQQTSQNSPLPSKRTCKRWINKDLHKKCTAKSKQIDGCMSCCVIMYNLLETDKFSEMVTPTPSNATPKSSSTSINLCSISDGKVHEFHEYERTNRSYYQRLFNPTKTFPTNVLKDRVKVMEEYKSPLKTDRRIESNRLSPEKVKKIINLTSKGDNRNCTERGTTADAPIEMESSIKRPEISIENDGPKESENVFEIRDCDNMPDGAVTLLQTEGEASSHFNQETAVQKEKAVETNLIETEHCEVKAIQKCPSPDKMNNKPGEKVDQGSRQGHALLNLDDEDRKRAKRRREKDETKREKDKKFERLEHERKRKSSETKKSCKTDNRLSPTKVIPLPSCLSPTKGSPMPSFRIPKAEGVISKKVSKPILSTPLAKVVEDDKFRSITTTKDKKDKDKHKHRSSSSSTIPDQNNSQPKQQQSIDISNRNKKLENWEVIPESETVADKEDHDQCGIPKLETIDNIGTKIHHQPSVAVDDLGTQSDWKKEEDENKCQYFSTSKANDELPDSQLQKQQPISDSINQLKEEQVLDGIPELPVLDVAVVSDPAIKISINNSIKIKAVEECQVEVVPADADDPCDSSVPSDGDRTIPPVTELQIGRFALGVTELVQKQSDSRVITFEECFSRKADATTEKCAWWFAKCDPEFEDIRLPRLESVTSLCGSDQGSDTSFLGNVSDSEIRDDDCQVHEISSTSHKQQDRSWSSSKVVRDPDKVDEYCGRSLLQAKIRTSTGQNFRNLFDLRAGALYEKENFQAKCNLCNQLIVGKKDLSTHVRGASHKENLRKLDLHMEKAENSTDSSTKKSTNGNSNSPKRGVPIKKEKESAESFSKSKSSSKNPDTEDSKENARKIKKEREDKHSRVKVEPGGARIEYGTTSTGLSVKIPLNDEGKIIRRSTKSPEPHDDRPSSSRSGRNDSESPTKRRRRTRSKSPPVRIPRSPLALRKSRRSRSPKSPDRPRRHSRRSRSRSRSPNNRSSRRRRSDSEEYHHRRRSPGKSSRRIRRSRSKSKSPQLLKKDNREFHAKLALTADGKWTDEMEKQWKLMEAEEAMFREQFIDRRKELVSTPEEHPRYATEWTEFWERRYQEVEKEGKDPDTYNYVTEWKDYWSKRLNFLLQEEADEKIRDIKKKYKMDFETLNLLRKNIPQQPQPVQHPDRVFFERQKSAPILNPTTFTVDSHSSNGHGSVAELNNMSSGMSVLSGNINIKGEDLSRIPERKPSVSVEDFKTTWEALTRTKSVGGSITGQATKTTLNSQDSVFIPEFSVTTPFSQPPNRTSIMSDATTSSDGSFDFMGFDLVQVLRLMCKAEDQLSFLAPKVLEYYKIAEELELKKSKGSHILLCNEELVTVMFQARDRFMTLIRSNVLGREILQNLNLTVYGLNAILDAPQCQKFRPKVPAPFLDPFAGASVPVETPVKPEEPALPKIEPLASPTDIENEIRLLPSLVAHLSSGAKSIIAGELSKYLLLMGGQNMSNSELQEFVAKMVTPLVKKANDSWEEKPDASDVDLKNQGQAQDLNNAFDINMVKPETTVLGHDYTHSYDMRITGVSGSKAVGSALPALPHMSYRSSSMEDPPTPPRGRSNPFIETTDRRANINNNSTYENMPSSHSSQQPQSRGRESDGRRSPFSRRELPMNPDRDRY